MAVVPFIDIFAGPGGLSEGFSRFASFTGSDTCFESHLAIEKDPVAARTLELRSFYRSFSEGEVPDDYYQVIRGRKAASSLALYPEWNTAEQHVWNAELGVEPEASLHHRIAEALNGESHWVLLGGPPCQAYSLMGRARMTGIGAAARAEGGDLEKLRKGKRADFATDHRHVLYREYLRIVAVHQPAVFVMENVKGILSSRLSESNGETGRVFEQIRADLSDPQAALDKDVETDLLTATRTKPAHRYHLYSLIVGGQRRDAEVADSEFLIRSEKFGIPQKRHRVILLGVRDDLVARPGALTSSSIADVRQAIGDFPPLRSGLSKADDGWGDWVRAIRNAFISNGGPLPGSEQVQEIICDFLYNVTDELDRGGAFTNRTPRRHNTELARWCLDPRLNGIIQHESRSHMTGDLARYLYAAAAAEVTGNSPKLEQWPVGEAIQNSLDARLDQNKPVVIRFSFHEDRLGKRAKFLEEAIAYRKQASLPVPSEWEAGKVKWIAVEDSNTKGLLGGLNDRKGDFWGYWLNFGLSNKTGRGRGGRGIGRVTFLIASKMHTVIGLTRRSADGAMAGCGMCVLKADQYGVEFKSTHAYLAQEEQGSVYDLHSSTDFHSQLEEVFELAPYSQEVDRTGLSLIIPYPHDELTEDGILAAAIDHFAPAILNGSLVVEVGIDRLDQHTITQVAPCVAQYIKSKAVAGGVERYLDMIEEGLAGVTIEVDLPNAKAKLAAQRDSAAAVQLRSDLLGGGEIAFSLRFPMSKNGVISTVSLTVVARLTPYGKLPLDRFFREGMSLPDVRTRRPADIDLILLVEDEPLAQYLNFCEGKAHLDLLASKEVKNKLAEAGFDGIHIRNLIKSLPDDLREFLTEESTEPDSSVWEGYFSILDPESQKKRVPKASKDDPEPPPAPPVPPLPPANVSAVIVDTLADGFRLRPNPEYTKFPAFVDIAIAYADGSAKPSWSEFDFRPKDLRTTTEMCTYDFTDNRLRIWDWSEDSIAEVTGFDARRELDTRIRTESNASQD